MALPYETKKLPSGSLLDLYSDSAGPIWARSLGSLQDTFLQALGMKYKMDQFQQQQDLDERKVNLSSDAAMFT